MISPTPMEIKIGKLSDNNPREREKEERERREEYEGEGAVCGFGAVRRGLH
ncbi:hypothetical protein Hdeb2414_s0023g00638981 [Helianthus debilis subsp. tardiflorus]